VELTLGVSMGATAVRTALVEGDKADGYLIEQDVFDITANDGSEDSSVSDVIDVILGTQEGAFAASQHLASIGVAWNDETHAAALREALIARSLDDVLLVSELHAAGALAQAVGRTLAYDKTALMFVDGDTATLAVIDSADGSVAKVLSRNHYSADADAIATIIDMLPSLEAEQPQGLFVIGSDVDVTSVKAHLTHVSSLPVIASEEPHLALARGAALAAANAPRFDTSTIGLAYSQDSGVTVVHPTALADGTTGILHHDGASTDANDVPRGSKPLLLVGSTSAIFAVGVIALTVAVAVRIQPAVEQDLREVTTHPNELVQPPTIVSAAPAEPQPVPMPPAAAIETARHVVPPAPPPERVFVNNAGPAPAAPPPAPVVAPPVIQWPAPPVLPVVQLPPLIPLWPPKINAPAKPPWDIGGKGRGHGSGKGPGKGH
jgi:hypothetical protein